MNVSRGLLIGGLFALTAPIAANMYHEPRLLNVMLMLAASVAIAGFHNPKAVILARNLEFWQDFTVTVSQKLSAFLVGGAIAIIYKSYWALVGGIVVGQVVGNILTYVVIPFRPRFSFKYARELWSFSIWLSFSHVINIFILKLDQLLVGGYLGQKVLGYYTVGDNLAGMPTRELVSPLETTLFPGFAKIAHDNARLRVAYRSAQSLVSAIALPAGFGCALIAHSLVLLGMGEKWLPAALVIQVIAGAVAFQTLSSAVNPLAMAKGETKLLFTLDIISFAVRVPFIIAGIWLGGMIGLLYARAFTSVISVMINMAFVRRLIGTGIIEQFSANKRSLISVLAMAIAVLLLEYMIGRDGPPVILALKIAAFVLLGAIVYITTHVLLWMMAKKPSGPEHEIIRMSTKVLSKFNVQIL